MDEIEPFSFYAIDGRRVMATLASATVLQEGWEMDNRAWAVLLEDRACVVILTTHQSPYIASDDEVRDLIEKTRASLTGLENMAKIREQINRATSATPPDTGAPPA